MTDTEAELLNELDSIIDGLIDKYGIDFVQTILQSKVKSKKEKIRRLGHEAILNTGKEIVALRLTGLKTREIAEHIGVPSNKVRAWENKYRRWASHPARRRQLDDNR